MKCIDVLINVNKLDQIFVYDADTRKRIGSFTANVRNGICNIFAAIPTEAAGFDSYFIISADNYTDKRLLAFWDYGPDKVVLDIPADTGSGRMGEVFDYSIYPIFEGYLFKHLKLMPGAELFMDPAFSMIVVNEGDVKNIPLTPYVSNMIGIKLEEA